MQENRSFDSYFGTFPNPASSVVPNGTATAGVNGINNAPAGNRSLSTCFQGQAYNPGLLTTTVNPLPPTAQVLFDLPHVMQGAKTALGCKTPAAPSRVCSATGALKIRDFLQATKDVKGCTNTATPDPQMLQTVGHYQGTNTGDALYNYWTIAKNCLVQDAMFEPVPSWSQVSHNFMVSGWSRTAPPMTRRSGLARPDRRIGTSPADTTAGTR